MASTFQTALTPPWVKASPYRTAPFSKGGENGGDVTDDIYITIDLLNKIWPLDFEIDTLSQSVAINTKRKLPFELELERKRRQDKLERQKKEEEERKKFQDKFTYTHNGYRLLGPQTFFLSQRLRWNNSQKDLRNDAFVSGHGDLLGTSANYSLSLSKSDKHPIDPGRFHRSLQTPGLQKRKTSSIQS